MSDRFPAKISFGGKVPASLKNELVKFIWREDFEFVNGWGYENTITDLEEVQSALDIAAKENRPVCFSDNQAHYGKFKQLEKFLVENNIDFDRVSDSFVDNDGETILCRNRKLIRFYSSQTGVLLVPYDDVRKEIDIVTFNLLESIKNQPEINKIEHDVKNLMTNFLEKIMQIAPNIPSLEPLEFVD